MTCLQRQSVYKDKDKVSGANSESNCQKGKFSKTESPSKSSKLSISTLLIMIFFIGPVFGASPPSSFDQFAENSTKLTQFMNSLYLGQAVADHNLCKKSLAEELFSLGNEVTLDRLASFELGDLVGKLGSMKTSIGVRCNEASGCGVDEYILKNIETVSSYQKHVKVFEEALKAASNIKEDELKELIDHFVSIQQSKEVVDDLVKKLEEKAGKTIEDVKEELKKAESLLEIYKKSSAVIKKFKTSLEELKKNWEKMVAFAAIQSEIKIDSNTMRSLRENLKGVIGRHNEINPLDVNYLENILKNIILKVNPSSNKGKIVTPGFFDGFGDLEMAKFLYRDSWLNDFFNHGNELNFTNLKIDLLKPIILHMDELASKFGSVKWSFRLDWSVIKPLLTVNLGKARKQKVLLDAYSQCISNLEMVEASDNPELKENFISDYTSFIITDDEISAFESSLKSSTIKGFIEGLEKVQTKLGKMPKQEWSKIIKIKDDVMSRIKKSNFISSMKCLHKKRYDMKIRWLNPAFAELSSLNSSNTDFDSAISLIKSLSELSEQWKTFTKEVASDWHGPLGPDDRKQMIMLISLAKISSAVHKMSLMMQKKEDLVRILDGSDQISLAIEKIKDVDSRDELKRMWSFYGVMALKNNLKIAEKVAKQVENLRINRLADFRKPFLTAAENWYCTIDLRLLWVVLKERIEDEEVRNSLERVESLNVMFYGYNPTILDYLFDDLEGYFNGFFPKIKTPCVNCNEPEPEPWSFWEFLKIPIVRGIIWLIFAFGTWIYVIHKKQKKAREMRQQRKRERGGAKEVKKDA